MNQREESREKSQAGRIVLNVVVLVVVLVVCYWRVASVRRLVDGHVPWIKARTARFFPEAIPPAPASVVDVPAPEVAASVPVSVEEPAAAEVPVPTEAPAPVEVEPVAVADTAAAQAPAPMEMHSLASNKAAWPKTVTLLKPTRFPAVVGGKIVGKITAPAGSEAKVVVVQETHVGVEYHGGGAWVAPADTNVLEKVSVR